MLHTTKKKVFYTPLNPAWRDIINVKPGVGRGRETQKAKSEMPTITNESKEIEENSKNQSFPKAEKLPFVFCSRKTSLKDEYRLDGAHLHPNYVQLLAESLVLPT